MYCMLIAAEQQRYLLFRCFFIYICAKFAQISRYFMLFLHKNETWIPLTVKRFHNKM
ncbi:hypothetical protein A8990_11752 [Paenibacillus taihuensis]|uniref:Uncharacterized protein n=1 Tax=Paenibacillus taihuensis TaxID=1156355 RepID=A0A3D9RTB4_9BACL|nr:hypothetical protein A8990_11752 [Paenibacillus taihuensis]